MLWNGMLQPLGGLEVAMPLWGSLDLVFRWRDNKLFCFLSVVDWREC